MTPKPYFEVRKSTIHGRGAFALRKIRKGTEIAEYTGERISHAAAERRYRHSRSGAAMLFTLNNHVKIDGRRGGNASRYINHCCAPNCEAINTGKKILIEALSTIEPGEEITFDYWLDRRRDDPKDLERYYPCRCGKPSCRGTQLAPKAKRKKRRKA